MQNAVDLHSTWFLLYIRKLMSSNDNNYFHQPNSICLKQRTWVRAAQDMSITTLELSLNLCFLFLLLHLQTSIIFWLCIAKPKADKMTTKSKLINVLVMWTRFKTWFEFPIKVLHIFGSRSHKFTNLFKCQEFRQYYISPEEDLGKRIVIFPERRGKKINSSRHAVITGLSTCQRINGIYRSSKFWNGMSWMMTW